MKSPVAIILSLLMMALILFIVGCEKEKVVESTEYVHDIEYIELPADTVYKVDTVLTQDSVAIHNTDTVTVSDTVIQVDYIYDTVVVTDTLLTIQCDPNEHFAVAAMQYYCDPLVIQFVNQEFGLTDGWIFYLSAFQVGLSEPSSDVYDIHGYIDYWTPDWSAFYPLEFYWRMTYSGGDPADLDNWHLSEPPASVSSYQPGVRLAPDGAEARQTIR
jgi:hypothetical protein